MISIKLIRRLWFSLSVGSGILLVSLTTAAAPHPKHPLVLISLDGFRYDYMDKYTAPNLKKLAKTGVRAVKMRPSYPSVTFPNHITLVTGQYPEHHGIIHNNFYSAQQNDT
ncbi:MAG: alkaline phosphatase family protein [Sedimentisphaerales bacterium]|nr:alkaline phosphatase family protein [Sedimentisphaerales bacterium]